MTDSLATVATRTWDLTSIRRDFPILHRPLPKGLPLVYLDNAASTQKPRAVIDALGRIRRGEITGSLTILPYGAATAGCAGKDLAEFEAVQARPATSTLSLMAIGMPSRGPSGRPA